MHLKEILFLFFKLGVTAFGGPAAHIAMFHKEVVDKRKWMNEKHFLDLVSATSLIPGPNSTEMAIHCGFHRAGLLGLFTSGIAFIFPACLLTTLLAYLYKITQTIPNIESYLIGIKAVVIILLLQAIKKLWKKAITKKIHILIAIIVIALGLIGISEVFCLLIGSLIGLALLSIDFKSQKNGIDLVSIFLVFSKIGSVLFGSGYVLIAYLQDELVHQRGWLTNAQIADAIAIGQLTPGPVLSSSAFVGYLLNGGMGAVVASIGIFLPSFLFVYLLNPLIPKMRNSKILSKLLDSLNAGSIGLMIYALYPLSKISLIDPIGIIVFVLSSFLVWKFKKISSVKLVLIGLLFGILFTHLNALL